MSDHDSLAQLRDQIVRAVQEERTAEYIGGLVHQLARAEGDNDARDRIAVAKKDGASLQLLYRILLNTMVRGADDDWSGRLNDLRRSYCDGVRLAVLDLKHNIEFLMEHEEAKGAH